MSTQNLMTSEETFCCGIHVINCAKIVALIGIFNALFSIISAIFLWYYIPFAFVSFLIYAYVLMGIQLQRPSRLLPAVIILSINFILNVFTFITLITVGSIAPIGLATTYTNESDGDNDKARAVIRAAYFITAAFVFVSTAYSLFALSVIQKARHFMISESRMPSSFSSTEFPSTQLSSNLTTTIHPPMFAQPKPQPPPPPPYSETL